MSEKQPEIVKDKALDPVLQQLHDLQPETPGSWDQHAQKALINLNHAFAVVRDAAQRIRIIDAVARIKNTAALNGMRELAIKCGGAILRFEAQIAAQNPPKRLKRKSDVTAAVISSKTLSVMRKAYSAPDQLEDFIADCESQKKIPTRELLLQTKAKREQDARIQRARDRKLTKFEQKRLADTHFHTLPINELKEALRPESVDLIFTDPPYTKEGIGTYAELSHFSAKVLKPGGSLLAVSGAMYLPQILEGICSAPGINYNWILSVFLSGGLTPTNIQRHVFSQAKLVIWAVKGKLPKGAPMVNNAIKPPDRRTSSNEFHKWGQSVAAMTAILEKGFGFPGETVCDPFAGSGSLALAAHQRGCRVILSDKNAEYMAIARSRFADLISKTGEFKK